MDDKQIKIMLMFGTDAGKANAELQKMNEKFAQLGKRAEELRGVIDLRKSMGLDSGEIQQDLKSVESEMEKVAEDARKAKVAIDGMAKGSRDVRDNLYNLRDIGEKLNQIGMGMQNAGNALLSPLQNAMAAYMEQQAAIKEAGGQMSKSAKAYLDAQKQMQQAYVRIGAIATDKLVPVIEKAANLLTKFADFLEQHPELVTAIAGLGVGLVGLGKVVSLAGQVSMIAGTLQGLGVGGAIPGGAAGTAALGTTAATAGSAALLVAAPIVGANIAKYVGNAFQRAMGQEESSWSDIGNTAKQTVMLPSKLALLGLVNLGIVSEETGAKINNFQNELWNFGDAAKEAAPATEKTAEELLAAAEAAKQRAEAEQQLAKAYEDFKNQEMEALRQYEQSKTKITENANRAALDAQRSHTQSLAKIEEDYAKQRESLLGNFQKEETRSAREYQISRAQAIRDGGEEIQRIEKDHQKRLAELAQGHNERMGDLIANRDALGIVKENQAYEKSRQDEERNANEEIAQRRRDIAQRLRDMAQAYALERQQRAQELQQSLAEAAANHAQQKQEEQKRFAEEERKRKEDTARQLRELNTQYQEESRRRRDAFLRSIRDLDSALNGETNRKRQYYALMLKDAEEFMKKYRTQMYPSDPAKKASGGYVTDGIYRLGEVGTEYVINAQTTRALEGMAGGSLTQDRLLAMASGNVRARAGGNMTLQQTIHFNGENNAANRAQLRSLIHTVALEAIDQVMVR